MSRIGSLQTLRRWTFPTDQGSEPLWYQYSWISIWPLFWSKEENENRLEVGWKATAVVEPWNPAAWPSKTRGGAPYKVSPFPAVVRSAETKVVDFRTGARVVDRLGSYVLDGLL
mmetsp:Transcript_10732/g.33107  ORF Transcript_10732/g.33107 Transcript_10732/m.33107 type:complete len:114 (+) Transcript_10732:179-520(+)